MLASGNLDPTFDLDGLLISNPLGFVEDAFAVSVQSDGKIVVAGSVQFTGSSGTMAFGVARFNLNGSLDTSFGNEPVGDLDLIPGLATIDFDASRNDVPPGSSFPANGRDLLIDPLGRIVVVGSVPTSIGDRGIGLVRLTATGQLDSSFGIGGKVLTVDGLTTTIEDPFAVALQSDGTIVVAGSKQSGASATLNFMLARYNGTTGALIGSVTSTDFAGGDDRANDVVVQSDDKIVLAGTGTPIGLLRQFAVARYDASGALDTSFDGDGKLFVDITAGVAVTEEVFSAAMDGTKIVLAGTTIGSGSSPAYVAMARLLSDGSLDATFNDTGGLAPSTAAGTAAYDIPTANGINILRDECFGLAIQQDGNYVVAGLVRNVTGTINRQVMVGRILSSGAADTTFDSNGLDGSLDAFVVTQIVGGLSSEQFWDVAMAPDGKIVAAGIASNANMLVARYESGQLVAEAGGPYTIDEPGGSVVLAGSAVGAGTLTFTWDLDNDGIFGELAGPGLYGDENGATPTFSVAGVDGPVVYPVKLRVQTDLNGDLIIDQTAEDTSTVTVVNVAPTAVLSNGGAVNEGSTGSVSFSGQFDPSPDDTTAGFHYSYDFNNDGVWEVGNGSYALSVVADSQVVPASFLADGAASYTVKARILDDDGGFTDYTTVIAVNNVAPTLTISGAASTNENAVYTLSLSSSDPGADTITSWTIDWGDGSEVVAGNPTSATHTYADGANSYTVTATATDEDGTFGSNSIAVAVDNVAPTLAISGGASVSEGAVYTLSLSSTDPGTDSISSWTINWGDGSEVVSGNPSSVTHTYADGFNSYTIAATATDEDGTYSANTVAVTVDNVAPALLISGAASVDEGSVYTLSLSSSDPGTDTIANWTIDWGDGSEVVAGNPSSATHTYADGANGYVVSATATDEDGTFSSNSIAVTVDDVAPTLVISGAASVDEGGVYTLSLSSSDPGADTITSWTIDWGDGSEVVAGNPSSATHTYADGTVNYTVSATATDEDGTFSSNSISVAVANVAPTLTISGAASVDEGGVYTLNLSSSDPGADTITSWTIDWGDGSEVVAGNPSSATHTYADGTVNYTVSATATDEDGTFSSNSISVTVNNLAPTADTGGPYTVGEGGTVTLSGSGTDPAGAADPLTFAWDLDDNGSFETSGASPTFSAAGFDGPTSQTIHLQVSDGDGGVTTATTTVSVVNVAPTADAGGPYLTFDDTPIALAGSGSDPAGALDPLSFAWDLDGDNVFGETGGAATRGDEIGASPTFDPTGLSTGSYTVELRVSDGDGGVTTDTATVNVLTAGTLLIDGTLYIVGTDSCDIVLISKCNNTIYVCATFNDSNPVTFNSADVSDIQVRMRGGHDIVLTTSNVMQTMTIDGGSSNDLLTGGGGRNIISGGSGHDFLYGAGGDDVLLGGTGNDFLSGGSGNDVLVGGDGDDVLKGGSGRDLIIGSQDNDWLEGGGDEDILIGGYTVHDNVLAALDAVMAIWTSSASFAARVNTLKGCGGLLQGGVAVFDDDDGDYINGGSGRDLIFGDTYLWDGAIDLIALQSTQDVLVAVN